MAQDRNYRKSFVFHSEWLISIDEIENGEDQLLIYRAIVSYATRGIVPELPSYLRPVWKPFQIQIDNDVVKWNEIRDKRQAAGQRGGLAKQANATKCYQMLPNDSKSKQTIANQAVLLCDNNVSVDNNDVILKKKTEDKSSVKKEKNFVRPSLDEVREYVINKGYHFDSEMFHAYYESKGWLVGKSPMKDWHAACVTWEKSYKGKHPIPTAANQTAANIQDNEKWQY